MVFGLIIANGDMDGIIRTAKSEDDSGLLIDGATETVKLEIKKTRRWNVWYYETTPSCFTDSTYGFFIDKHNIWKMAKRWISFVISITFNGEGFEKKSRKNEKGYMTGNILLNFFGFAPSFHQY